MSKVNTLKIRHFLVSGMVAILGSGTPASAANDPPDLEFAFPAGIACSFELLIQGWNGKQPIKEIIKDKNGFVRVLNAGTGSALLYTNVATGATFSTRSNGSVNRTTYNPDGSFKWELTGHSLVIFYPTDIPAGPSTTLYVGRVVITNDASFNSTMQSTSGGIFAPRKPLPLLGFRRGQKFSTPV